MAQASIELKLPNSIVSKTDVVRLQRELNSLEDFFVGAAARTAGTAIQPPRLTRQLDSLAKENEYNLLDSDSRRQLAEALRQLIKNAPCLHISFAAEPSAKPLEQIITWLRQNIHQQALVQVGLQPSIAAGCVLRTSNKVFDMSMRTSLKKQQPYLVKLIVGAIGG